MHNLIIQSFSVLGFMWDSLFFAMIGYFVKSIIEASATSQYKKSMEESEIKAQWEILNQHSKSIFIDM